MKNTSIFIPALLIVCLIALIYLFFAALRAAEEDDGREQSAIVLNEADYRDPADDPATLNTRTGEVPPADTGLFVEVPEAEKFPADTSTPLVTSPSGGTTNIAPPQTAPSPTVAPTVVTTTNGRYLVIAGTFSQLAGAQERVAALQAAGFNEATVEKFNRGKYAVALAGQTNSYRTASSLADQIRSRGFEVRVMKRK